MGRISIEEAPAWARLLGPKLHKAAEKGLLSAAYRLVGVIQNEIIPAEKRVPVDKGIYRAGWRVRKIERGAMLFNGVPHAAFIEDGVRAKNVKIGRAMIDALAEWVKRHGLTGSAKKEERNAAARQIAWAIAKQMQKRGIFGEKGLGILRRALERAPAIMEEEIRDEIRKMKTE